MSDVVLLARAFDFACQSHTPQRRKGAAAEPYINHLADVALRVAEATEGRDANLVAAALLHDTIEDTPVSYEELETAFGPDIAALVAEVTDDKSLEKHVRKELQVTEAHKKSDRARMLKLADKASNLASLVASPPDWPVEIQLQYADWAERVGQGLRGVNERLEREFDAAVAALREHHG